MPWACATWVNYTWRHAPSMNFASRYTVEHPGQDDLIFGQFEKLTAHFLEVANIDTKEQRMDSTQILPDIKRAGRLSLAYDILVQATKACPSEILTEELKRVPEPDYKRQALYRLQRKQGNLRQLPSVSP